MSFYTTFAGNIHDFYMMKFKFQSIVAFKASSYNKDSTNLLLVDFNSSNPFDASKALLVNKCRYNIAQKVSLRHCYIDDVDGRWR